MRNKKQKRQHIHEEMTMAELEEWFLVEFEKVRKQQSRGVEAAAVPEPK
jgi:hypothetical protein